jgi:hypothetical protein
MLKGKGESDKKLEEDCNLFALIDLLPGGGFEPA